MATIPLHDSALDALGDANRRAIIEMLGSGERSVQQIADAMPISRPAVSRHLRMLKDAGLVGDCADGPRRVYHLEGEGVEAVHRYLVHTWGDAVARYRIVVENTSRHRE